MQMYKLKHLVLLFFLLFFVEAFHTTQERGAHHIIQRPLSKRMADCYIFVRASDSVIVQSSAQQPNQIAAFSSIEFDKLGRHFSSLNSSPRRRLFSFPHEEKSNFLTTVYEHTLVNVNKSILRSLENGDLIYKIITLKELGQLQHQMPPSISKHVVQLYMQHYHDSRLNKRLLRGTSGSDIDSYTLRPIPKVIFFDCDDCLYFDNWTIAGHLTRKIEDHCQKEFDLPNGRAYELYKEYGTCLRGLMAEGYVDRNCQNSVDDFLVKVHDLPIHEMLEADERLRQIILDIDPTIRKFVFTASVRHHAMRCLEALGIDDLFEGIIDVKDCNFETKHSISSFQVAMKKAGVVNAEECIFFDDSVTNISAAAKVGWRSILVGTSGRDCGKRITSEHAELEIDRIHDMKLVLPELFLHKY